MAVGSDTTPLTGRVGRVRILAPDAAGVVRIDISPSPVRSLVTIASETLIGVAVVVVITAVARLLNNAGMLAMAPAWWAAAACLPWLATIDTLIFGQRERHFVGASTLALRPPLGDWYVLRRVSGLDPRYEPADRPWWTGQSELGQQGAGVILIGPRSVGVRIGNGLSEDEAASVLAAIESVPADVGVHHEVGPTTRDITIRALVGVAIAVLAFALVFPGLTRPEWRWLVGVGDLILLWVAYRFWFNLFRRRPEYAQ